MKYVLYISLALVFLIIVGVVGLYILVYYYEWPISPPYSAKDFDRGLTKIAKTALPIINAMDNHFQRNGKYPEKFDEFKIYFPNAIHFPDPDMETYEYNGWSYYRIKTETGYRLWRSLGRDPSLKYISDNKQWIFDPGDGTEVKSINLKLD